MTILFRDLLTFHKEVLDPCGYGGRDITEPEEQLNTKRLDLFLRLGNKYFLSQEKVRAASKYKF